MIYYYDLHIHTVLSPCADVLMTPNNIFNMANLKGLNIIAITDHNSAKQLAICHEISQSYDLLFIPGIEISLKEGFHVLCYFKTLEDALSFGVFLEAYIDKSAYDSNYYGEQHLTDINDEIINVYPYLLSKDTNLNFESLINELKKYEHILIYAHIDRTSHSGIKYIHSNPLSGVELTSRDNEQFIAMHHLDHYKILRNSDAHQLTDIFERTKLNQIDLNQLNIESFFAFFNHG